MINIENIRRVVTGHNAQGLSVIARDGSDLPWGESEHFPGMRWLDLWSETGLPVDNSEDVDRGVDCPIFPEENGLIYRILQIDPEAEAISELDPHPGMHKTQTMDLVYVLEGEIWLVLEAEERLLKQGDIFIQRGTNHAWSNRSEKPCSILGVLVGARG